MDICQITADYAVSPQIDANDLPAIKSAGFVAVICNRPDEEVPTEQQAATIRIATEAAGLAFHDIPVTHETLDMDMAARQMAVVAAAGGPVFAYCASGTRCTIVWALGQTGKMTPDDIIAAAAGAGYNLIGMKPRLEALAQG